MENKVNIDLKLICGLETWRVLHQLGATLNRNRPVAQHADSFRVLCSNVLHVSAAMF